ncbi:MAG: hypothetical protein LBT00_04820 [Spirochaetaceae bacterium]|jgi:hypothetical protein|nr:hypothetical protein [Spirochaetaceae bacterium]
MMKKWIGVLLGVLCFFACGDLPETKPSDWDKRQNFSSKRFTPPNSGWWSDVSLNLLNTTVSTQAQNIEKSERWRGSGKFSSGAPVYYIFKAANSVTVTIDWEYRRDDHIGFAYKKVGATVNDYGMDSEPIAVGQNEYLVMRISPPSGFSGSATTDWEIGFIVK